MKSLDEKLFFSLIKLTDHKATAYVMRTIAVYSPIVFMTTYGVFIVVLMMTRDPMLLAFLVGPALSLLTVIVIRRFIKRKRPFELFDIEPLIVHEKGSSFPSKHGTSAFAIAFAITWVHPLIGGVGIMLALLTGISRVMVGVHYPSDIFGGLLIAIVVSQLTYIIAIL